MKEKLNNSGNIGNIINTQKPPDRRIRYTSVGGDLPFIKPFSTLLIYFNYFVTCSAQRNMRSKIRKKKHECNAFISFSFEFYLADTLHRQNALHSKMRCILEVGSEQ